MKTYKAFIEVNIVRDLFLRKKPISRVWLQREQNGRILGAELRLKGGNAWLGYKIRMVYHIIYSSSNKCYSRSVHRKSKSIYLQLYPLGPRKRKIDEVGEDSSGKDCNVCHKKKAAGMIVCTKCKQWLHCSCVGLTYRGAVKLHLTFLCWRMQEEQLNYDSEYLISIVNDIEHQSYSHVL